jgi:glycosyltransferase involved in cell wall biosynthesis
MALRLVEHMGRQPRGHRITALIGPNAPKLLPWRGVDVFPVPGAMIDEPFEQLHLPAVLDQLNADVYVNTTFAIPALKTKAAQITVIHDVVFEDHPEWVEPRLRDFLQRWSRFSAKHADRIITISQHAAERIQAVYQIPSDRLVRIYNGFSSPQRHPPPGAIEGTLKRHGIHGPFLLYVGTMEIKKGVSELLVAYRMLRAKGFTGELVLAGGQGGPEFDFEAAIAATAHAKSIRQLGYVDEEDKLALLSVATAFVFPSHYEGFGLPPLEAMAYGTPCVVNDATSLPEVVGDAALRVDVTDAEAFTQALLTACQDESFRRRAKIDGPKRSAMFSWEKAASQYLDVCESVVPESSHQLALVK